MSWVLLTEYSQAYEAHILKSKLQTEGIEVQIENEHFNALYSGVTGVQVKVHPEDLEKAKEILRRAKIHAVDEDD